MAKTLRDLESLYAQGELDGTDGFRADTVNGVSMWKGTGWNKEPSWAFERPQVPEGGAWKGGRSNRSGE